MTPVTDWLLTTIVLAPIVGFVAGLVLAVLKLPEGLATALARTGLFISFLAAVSLICLLGNVGGVEPATAVWRLGTWIVISETRSLSIVWGFRAEFMTAAWLAVMTFLAWMALSIRKRDESGSPLIGFQLTAVLTTVASICFVLSGSLMQSLFFWGAISWTTLAMVVWSSPQAGGLRSIRALQTRLMTDVVLVLAVLMIGQASGSDKFEEICSVEGLTAMGARNPPLPGLIGCLLIVGAIGRCGLFPCFGWHRSTAAFHPSVGTFIYAVGSVPSAIWLLLKCQPLLLASDVPLPLLGGLGTLGMVVGAFVACGQTGSIRLAYVISAQAGLMLAALGSGLAVAAPQCLLHQCSLSAASFVLFAVSGGKLVCGRFRSWMIWCAALSMSGAFPFLGGWSQQILNELNAHPARWVLPDVDATSDAGVTNLAMKRIEPVALTLEPGGAPHWDWLIGLWGAQGMTAFAVSMAAFELVKRESGPSAAGRIARPTEDATVAVVATVLLVGGLFGWLFSDPAILNPNGLGRLVFSQLVTGVGWSAAWRLHRIRDTRPVSIDNCGSIVRLSRQALHIDHVEEIMIEHPLEALAKWSQFTLNFDLSLTIGWLIRLPASLGRQVESLQIDGERFDLIVILLGTASLLLALVLVI